MMEKEISLVKKDTNKVDIIISNIKKFFSKFIKKEKKITNEEVIYIKSSNEKKENFKGKTDFDYLKEIIEGKVNIKDLDKDLKNRLIKLCNARLEEVNNIIIETDKEIEKTKDIIKKKHAKKKFIEVASKFDAKKVVEKEFTSEEIEKLNKYFS